MRYLKAVLVALAGGVLLAAAVLSIEIGHAHRTVSSDCQTYFASDRTTMVCGGAVQVGGLELLVAFVVGFTAALTLLLRWRRGAR